MRQLAVLPRDQVGVVASPQTDRRIPYVYSARGGAAARIHGGAHGGRGSYARRECGGGIEELGLGLPRCLSHMRSCLRVATSHAHLITNSTRTIEDLHGARILHSTRVCRLKKLRVSTAHTTSRNGVARNKAQARVQRPASGAAKPPSNGHERL